MSANLLLLYDINIKIYFGFKLNELNDLKYYKLNERCYQ